MNFKLKNLLACASITTFSAFALSSCDGESQSPQAELTPNFLASIAQSLDNVILNDIIEYKTSDGSKPFLNSLTFGGNLTTVGDAEYTYNKRPGSEFELRVKIDADAALSRSLTNTIGGALDAPLGARLRVLLLRAEPANYTQAELEEIRDILNGHGARLQINDAKTGLRAPRDQVYEHTITSTERERILGSMGGFYKLQSFGSEIIFRKATPSEASQFRFFDNSLLPIVAQESFKDQTDETGTFNLEFINRP